MNDYRLELVAGGSRSGKSRETAQRIKREKFVLVWDTMGEFADTFKCRRVTPDELRAVAASGRAGRYSFDVPVNAQNFDLFCRAAWLWLRVVAHRGHRPVLVVEELADVTPPGKAPAAWGQIVRKSLRFNPHIYALTQAPAESDKTVVRNATVLRCHTMQHVDDRHSMAKALDVPVARLDQLDFGKYQYLERDRRTGKLTTAGKGIKARTLK